tara:strand:+ start:1436 stop:3256 length:1821 start_codon:yes stop_codon:yes gene_type:complete
MGNKQVAVATARPARRDGLKKKKIISAWRVVRLASLATIWGAVAIVLVVVYEATQLPDISQIDYRERNIGLRLMTKNRLEFASFGDLYMEPVEFKEIPEALISALLATEDRRFHSHFGIDLISIARAIVINVKDGTIKQGGSTLTQQLAKNLFLTFDRSFERKVQELLLSFWLETSFTKEQILTLYLNRVYFGAGTYGIQSAANHYFGKPVSALKLYDAALLVGLLKAPSRYNPIINPELSKKRTRQVLENMVSAGKLSSTDAKSAYRDRSIIRVKKIVSRGHRYFADWVRERSVAYVPNFPGDRKISTTIDMVLQRKAEDAIQNGLKLGKSRKVEQAAMVVLDKTGAVLAMVGGKNHAHSQFNRATQALRQPGSAFKPIVFLAALLSGFEPGTMIPDSPLKIGDWAPRNFDGKFRNLVSLKEALAMSYNVASVRLSTKVGRAKIIKIAHRMGIVSKLDDEPSLALGTSEVSLLQITAGYAAIANGGHPVEPYGVTEITSRGEKVIYKRRSQLGPRIASNKEIAAMNEMMEEVILAGTGKQADIGRQAAGKTGTSQGHRDAWFIGYAGELVAGVWVGRDDASSMIGVTGGGLPAAIWSQFMQEALK